jgi:hypothetical protein
MGLGKTAQALAAAFHFRRDWPLLIICPPSLIGNWRAELERWCRLPYDAIWVKRDKSKRAEASVPPGVRVVICGYTCVEGLHGVPFQVVICDESHFLKSEDAERTKATRTICAAAKRVLLLSGTPTAARPIELYAQLGILASDGGAGRTSRGVAPDSPPPPPPASTYLPNRIEYGMRYCGGFHSGLRYEFMRHSHLQELQAVLRTVMIRRAKAEVLGQLPKKEREVFYLTLPDRAVETFRKQAAAACGSIAIADVVRSNNTSAFELFNITAKVKAAAVGEYVSHLMCDDDDEDGSGGGGGGGAAPREDADDGAASGTKGGRGRGGGRGGGAKGRSKKANDEGGDGEEAADGAAEGDNDTNNAPPKYLFFAHHQEMLDTIERAVRGASRKRPIDCIRIDGSTNVKHRDELVAHFSRTRTCRAAVLSMGAAGTGLNLTAASRVVFCELHWTPSLLQQCEDRVHRIGQRDVCTIRYLLAPGTVDDAIWPMLSAKLAVTQSILLDRALSAADTQLVQGEQMPPLPNGASKGSSSSRPQSQSASAPKLVTLDRWLKPTGAAAAVSIDDDDDDLMGRAFNVDGNGAIVLDEPVSDVVPVPDAIQNHAQSTSTTLMPPTLAPPTFPLQLQQPLQQQPLQQQPLQQQPLQQQPLQQQPLQQQPPQQQPLQQQPLQQQPLQQQPLQQQPSLAVAAAAAGPPKRTAFVPGGAATTAAAASPVPAVVASYHPLQVSANVAGVFDGVASGAALPMMPLFPPSSGTAAEAIPHHPVVAPSVPHHPAPTSAVLFASTPQRLDSRAFDGTAIAAYSPPPSLDHFHSSGSLGLGSGMDAPTTTGVAGIGPLTSQLAPAAIRPVRTPFVGTRTKFVPGGATAALNAPPASDSAAGGDFAVTPGGPAGVSAAAGERRAREE